MGWSRGSDLAEAIFNKLIFHLASEEEVREIAIFLYDKFCDQGVDDWDIDMSIMKYIPKDR